MDKSKGYNKSIKETKEAGECTSCMMNTICTFSEKEQKGRAGYCPSSVVFPSLTKEEKLDAEKGMEKMGFRKVEESAKTIPVVKMVYWDGSKYIFRTDRSGHKKVLCKLRVKMRSRLLALPIEEQIEIAHAQNMLKSTEERMSEEAYLKIKKG